MSSDFILAAQLKTDTGKGASRRLRHQGKIPGILYGGDKDAIMLTLAHNEFVHAIEDEAFFSHILTVEVDGAKEKVILKDMHRHPAKEQIMHVDFLRIDENKALHVHVPLHFMNEELAPGLKVGGIVAHLKTEVEVSCLPADLPEYIEVDIADLELNASIHLSDLILPKGITIIELSHGEDHDAPVASITKPRGEKIVEEEGAAAEGDAEEASEE
ncbi:MAG: 50S ribosomal protein L25/general stress protein Ctc [Pseudomonadota bacterium]